MKSLTFGLIVFMIAWNLPAADQLLFPIDPLQMEQTSAALQTAVRDGDSSAVITQGRRMMELYPNEPLIHASIYRLMAEAAQQSGDAALARQYAAVAKSLDPSLDNRMNSAPAGTATRGGKMDNVAAAMQLVVQGVQVYQAARAQSQAQRQSPQQVQPQQFQQQQVQQQQLQQQQLQQQQLQQQQIQQQMMQQQAQQQYAAQQGANVTFPPAPVGEPNYQQFQGAPAPMPGWAPPPQFPQPQPQGGGPFSAPIQPQQSPYPQASQQPIYAQQQPQLQAGGPYSPPMQQQQVAYPYPSGPAPYAGNAYAAPMGPTRGEKPPVFKVIHDHSRVGDAAYFQHSCGALLTVHGTNLTFTPSGGEGTLVIPSTDILEIRLNALVGRNAGEFHIGTRQGLYLSVVLVSQDRDEARAAVDTLRASLGLE